LQNSSINRVGRGHGSMSLSSLTRRKAATECGNLGTVQMRLGDSRSRLINLYLIKPRNLVKLLAIKVSNLLDI
jgi:hypothetical protein